VKKPLVDKTFRLEKYPGKGGWTYAAIPEIPRDGSTPFGWATVKGSIDNFQIKKYKLMPMGKGKMFLPVKAEIRKKIKKNSGEWVRVTLYPDDDPIEMPEDLATCLKDEPGAYKAFTAATFDEQLAIIKWINAAKTDKTKAVRISEIINRLIKSRLLNPKTPKKSSLTPSKNVGIKSRMKRP
jgi:hypothetical protein